MPTEPNQEEVAPRDLYGFTVEQLLDFVYHLLVNNSVDLRIMRSEYSAGYDISIHFILASGTVIQVKRSDVDVRKALHAAIDEVLRLK